MSASDYEIDLLLDKLPEDVVKGLKRNKSELIEVVMDLERPPEARFSDGKAEKLRDTPISFDDINHTISKLGDFGDDNRAGINHTLHRISAIRNTKGEVVGLTCRVGRPVFGMGKLIEDLLGGGSNILILGRPGVGKTTMLREVARNLSEGPEKRVVVVDTSNEIGGDGNSPHPAIGKARRMYVPETILQHKVMIEAVENHMPEVIVIDEMSTEQEVLAARTIAERGVQLVATAHGNRLINVLLNPTFSDLVGGVSTVTLGDEEARLRRTQKTIRERTHEPTFDVVVEIHSHTKVVVHHVVGEAVDRFLRGWSISCEVRTIDSDGQINSHLEEISMDVSKPPNGLSVSEPVSNTKNGVVDQTKVEETKVIKLCVFGISKPKIAEIALNMGVEVEFVDTPTQDSLFLTTKNHHQRRPTSVKLAESSGLPIYVLRKPSIDKIERFLTNITKKGGVDYEVQSAMDDFERAVLEFDKKKHPLPLEPQNAYIRRLQHKAASQAGFKSYSVGEEPKRRVILANY